MILRKLLCLILILSLPHVAQAHTSGLETGDWHNGFNHPLHGWDHLLTMIAVGMWAARE
jgi:Hydrogenase/urease accessory protein